MWDGLLSVSAVCEVDGAAYIVDNGGEKPCIFRYSIEAGETAFLACIERADPSAPKMTFVTTTYYKGRIFFVPKFLHGINYIVIYEIETGKVGYKEINNENFAPFCGYESLHRIENALWLFPQDVCHDVAVLSLDTLELSLIGSWSEAARGVQEKLGRQVRSGDTLLMGGVIYTPIADSGAVTAMSLRDRQVQVYWLNNDVRLTFPIVHDGGAFVVARRKNEGLLRWTPRDGVTAEIDIGTYENRRSKNYQGWFQKIFYSDGALWLLPKNDHVLLRINVATGEMKILPLGAQEEESILTDRQYWTVEDYGKLHIYPFYRQWWTEAVLEGEGLCKQPRILPVPKAWQDSQAVREMYTGAWKRRGVILEDSLPAFLDFVKSFEPTECDENDKKQEEK